VVDSNYGDHNDQRDEHSRRFGKTLRLKHATSDLLSMLWMSGKYGVIF
jgi:hypothetical protein